MAAAKVMREKTTGRLFHDSQLDEHGPTLPGLIDPSDRLFEEAWRRPAGVTVAQLPKPPSPRSRSHCRTATEAASRDSHTYRSHCVKHVPESYTTSNGLADALPTRRLTAAQDA
jgi:hypothetical protein